MTPDDRIAELAAGLKERELWSLLQILASRHGTDMNEVLSKSRLQEVRNARAACYRQLISRGMSSKEVARLLGVDDSTVRWTLKRRRDAA